MPISVTFSSAVSHRILAITDLIHFVRIYFFQDILLILHME